MTLAEFRVLFPEFDRASNALVQSRLTWAAARTPADVWGDLEDQGIAYMAADLLASLPGGKDLKKAPGISMYAAERLRLERIVASGFRIAGIPETPVS